MGRLAMTYWQFHVVFLLPPIALLALTLPASLNGVSARRRRWALPTICLIAFCYTTPWDNYLVYRNVWGYGPERVLATIGYVPVEEYAFFILQPILTGLFLYHWLARWTTDWQPQRPIDHHPGPRWVGAAVWGLLSIAGWALIAWSDPSGLYMGLILGWACPVIAGMWLYGGSVLWAHRRIIAYTVGLPTLYLWIADTTAIGLNIWYINDQYTLGVDLLGVLPIEEATFFLMTNILVVQGTLLFLIDLPEALTKRHRVLSSNA